MVFFEVHWCKYYGSMNVKMVYKQFSLKKLLVNLPKKFQRNGK